MQSRISGLKSLQTGAHINKTPDNENVSYDINQYKIAKRMVYENLIQVRVAKAAFQKRKPRSLADQE